MRKQCSALKIFSFSLILLSAATAIHTSRTPSAATLSTTSTRILPIRARKLISKNSWQKMSISRLNSPNAAPNNRQVTFRSPSIFPNIKPAKSISTICFAMRDGSRALTGSTKWSFRVCRTNLKLAMRIMCFSVMITSPLRCLKQSAPALTLQKVASRQSSMPTFLKKNMAADRLSFFPMALIHASGTISSIRSAGSLPFIQGATLKSFSTFAPDGQALNM